MALFDQSTIEAAVDTGPRSARTDVDKVFLGALFDDAAKGLFSVQGNTYPELHWDTSRRAYTWGQGSASPVDLYLQRKDVNTLELIAADNATRKNLHIGAATLDGVLTSNVTTGTAPFTVASTTQVTNLNASLLGGSALSALAELAADEDVTGAWDFTDPGIQFSGMRVWNVTHPDYGADNTGATDAVAAIQAAIDACEAAGGGIVFLPPGTYLFTGTNRLVIDRDMVWLKGAGIGTTILKLGNGISTANMTSAPNFILVAGYSDPQAFVEHVFISDLTVDGNRANQTYTTVSTAAINMYTNYDGGIFRAEVTGWHSPNAPGQEAVCIHGVNCQRSYITACHTSDSPEVQGARFSGQVIGSSAGCSINNHHSDGCLSGVVMWQMEMGTVTGCTDKASTTYGIDIEDSIGIAVTSNAVEEAQLSGIRFAESWYCSGVSNTCRNNNQAMGATSTECAGITINGVGTTYSQYITLTANTCFDDQVSPTQQYGIQEFQDANNNSIHGNTCVGNSTAEIFVTGASTEVRDNYEGSGDLSKVSWGPYVHMARQHRTLINDDAALRLSASNIPDHGICELIGGDINQSAIFYYDLGATMSQLTLLGGNVTLGGTYAFTGTDGTNGRLTLGASAAGLDFENRLGGVIAVSVHTRGF